MTSEVDFNHVLTSKANAGDSEAMFQLGVSCAFGRGVELDLEKALHWLKKAAKAGHTTARLVLEDIGQTGNASGGKSRSGGGGRCLSTGDTKTITLPGGAEMEMIYCAPGSFMMGSPEDEEDRFDDETQHKVTLTRGFWLGKYPVTQSQWKSVMGGNPSNFEGDDNPVDSVSWDDCKKFIKKINSRSGFTARFPTEAEWEYACRAGTEGAYSGAGDLDDMGWYDENSDDETHPVGEKEPNAWGFYDMHGNVLEWCADWYGSYPTKAVTDPKGPSSGGNRVLRGGSWGILARGCRSAFRRSYGPVLGYDLFGFRLCCSAGSHE
jgi:formylglycine-generating enzyme required for sulfatase activity